ncbi:MAG: EamA family transporter [Dehalococcoidales bacterium]|nr:EamA family transporter [Dehalococcoidales bacterium]
MSEEFDSRNKLRSVVLALLAAVAYSVSVPFSKILLDYVGPSAMAALLYLGAGIGVGLMSLFRNKSEKTSDKLSKKDLPFVIGMIVLDIAAPVFLMFGIDMGTSSNASLLGNFEIVATSVIALFVFKEMISKRLWIAILFITLASVVLSFEGFDSFDLSYGSLFVLLAMVCWGFENNCTRKISSMDTYEIVMLKGVFSGIGALIIAFIRHEGLPEIRFIALAMLLGFVSYGLSIFMYVRAQRTLGAAKTSAYYAVNPFIGAVLAFFIFKEDLSISFFIALLFMIIGAVLAIIDTLVRNHSHLHQHTFVHVHDGYRHSHTIIHDHGHDHYWIDEKHGHHHSQEELEEEAEAQHHHS